MEFIWPLRPNGFPGEPQPESVQRVIERYSLDGFIRSCGYKLDRTGVTKAERTVDTNSSDRGPKHP